MKSRRLLLRDVDLERGILSVRTSKLGAERTLKLSTAAAANLKTFVHRKKIEKLNAKLFPNPNRMRDMWDRCRKRAYLTLVDAELLKIRSYDLRHWFATTDFMKSRDIFHVQYLLGHRDSSAR